MAVALPSPPLHSISIRIISSQVEVKESRRIPTETKLANKDQGSRIKDPGSWILGTEGGERERRHAKLFQQEFPNRDRFSRNLLLFHLLPCRSFPGSPVRGDLTRRDGALGSESNMKRSMLGRRGIPESVSCVKMEHQIQLGFDWTIQGNDSPPPFSLSPSLPLSLCHLSLM